MSMPPEPAAVLVHGLAASWGRPRRLFRNHSVSPDGIPPETVQEYVFGWFELFTVWRLKLAETMLEL
jgi:hypothetical protein